MEHCEEIVGCCGYVADPAVDCHPHLRPRNATSAKIYQENCPEDHRPSYQGCAGRSHHYKQNTDSERKGTEENHLHFVSHSCPLGKIVCTTDCMKNDCSYDDDIIKAEDIIQTHETITYQPFSEDALPDDTPKSKERACCPTEQHHTEQRICRCDLSDPTDLKRCECECGAAVVKTLLPKKVRFVDEKPTVEDRYRVFKSMNSDVKKLCRCCQEVASKGKNDCVGRKVLVYEIPTPKFEGKSESRDAYQLRTIPRQPQYPPWHPYINEPWTHHKTPSLSESTYKGEFKPPKMIKKSNPVYLAPHEIDARKSDPCQELAEEYATWKKTTAGNAHTYHASCENCDRDLHNVHLHECDVSHLPAQYQCHGDEHISQPAYHTTGEKVIQCKVDNYENSPLQYQYHARGDVGQPEYDTLNKKFSFCEIGDSRNRSEKTAFPTKREVCVPSDMPDTSSCLGYTTPFKVQFQHPRKEENPESYVENCSACEFCKSSLAKSREDLYAKENCENLKTWRGGVM